jgi:hypothetical protein
MPHDWSREGLSELVSGRYGHYMEVDDVEPDSVASGVVAVPFTVPRLGFTAKCVIAGVSAALLYVWPVLFFVHIFFGVSDGVYWSILAAAAILATAVFAALAIAEERHWAENWQDAGDFADPPYWR